MLPLEYLLWSVYNVAVLVGVCVGVYVGVDVGVDVAVSVCVGVCVGVDSRSGCIGGNTSWGQLHRVMLHLV